MGLRTRTRIVVITATGQKARRDKLAGVYDYAHAHGWLVQTVENVSDARLLKAMLSEGTVDGIISDGFNAPVKIAPSTARRLPIVYIDRPDKRRPAADSVNNDDAACARLAAGTLMKLGLGQYAAVGVSSSVYWSRSRIRAFAAAIQAQGRRCLCFRAAGRVTDDIPRLREWLVRLPRPCGLFAVTDSVAKLCIDLLTEADVRVPDEIAVLGIDNDELVCENTTPSISSILPGFRQAGRLAAERLHRLIDGRSCHGIPTDYAPQAVNRRASTSRSLVRREKISDVLEFIRRHACLGIRIADVVAFAGMPKSTLELHFRQATSRSILQEIQRVRLAEVERLLRETRVPVGMIAARCGYHNDNYLKNLFKRLYGQTLSQYRADMV